jgi:hypothetical protein
MDCIAYNDRIQLAIADLESQESLNYVGIIKKKLECRPIHVVAAP